MEKIPLNQAIKQAGSSTRKLAEQLRLGEATMKRYSSGLRKPDVDTAHAIADALGISDRAIHWGHRMTEKDVQHDEN